MANGLVVLNAGGTIAMRPGPRGLEIDPDFLPRLQTELEQLGINPTYLDCFNLEPPIASTSATRPTGCAWPNGFAPGPTSTGASSFCTAPIPWPTAPPP